MWRSTISSAPQFIKFGLTGVMNTAIDFITFFILSSLGTTYYFAQIMSYSAGVVNSYFLNRTWTFEQKDRINKKEFIRFLTVNLVSLLLSTLVLKLSLQQGNLPLLYAKIIATLMGMGVNYGLVNAWVFEKGEEGK